VKESGPQEEYSHYFFHLLFTRSFEVICSTGISSTWTSLATGVQQRLPSATILFNPYIIATLKEVNRQHNGPYPYADDNTLGIQNPTQGVMM